MVERMDLVLVAKSLHDKRGQLIHKRFCERGGTIGRSSHDGWVLPDPQRYISNHHATIKYENGDYFLIDTSTNGVYLNNDEEAIGRDRSLKLSHGDRIYIGDYEILVELEAKQDAVIKQVDSLSNMGGIPDSLDPLDLFSHRDTTPQRNDEAISAVDHGIKDQSANLDEYFSPPDIKVKADKQIPDNWALTHIPEQVSENSATLEVPKDRGQTSVVNKKPHVTAPEKAVKTDEHMLSEQSRSAHEVPVIKKITSQKIPVAAPSLPVSTDEYDKLLQALGINKESVPLELLDVLPKTIGLLVRECISGLIGELMARTSMKSAFRVDQTTIQPVENNPLKFSVGVDEALENMLLKSDRGYLPALDAVREGFNDMKAHQMAMVAGMQGALQDILQRFDPEILEERFAVGSKENILLSAYNKTKYWAHYKELYEVINKEALDNFQNLLGEGFMKAYEDQMYKIKSADREPKEQSGKESLYD